MSEIKNLILKLSNLYINSSSKEELKENTKNKNLNLENIISEITSEMSNLSINNSEDLEEDISELCESFEKLTSKCSKEEREIYMGKFCIVVQNLISKSRCYENNQYVPKYIY
jgi:hypothetical protein